MVAGTTEVRNSVSRNMFNRVRMGSRSSNRPDSSGTTDQRPPSARGSSFVDRLRNMQLTTPTTSAQPRTLAGAGARGGASTVGRRSPDLIAPAGVRSTSGGVMGAPPPRPVGSVSSGASATAGVRRVPTKEQLGHASAHASAASGVPGSGPTAIRSGRTTPTPGARLAAASEPTGGLRAVGNNSPPPRSPGKLPPRDASPVKTHKQSAARPTGSTTPFMGLKVGITLMTRKPHRFDWWLRYHRSLGIYHVFVHVEDTPELLPLLHSDEFADFVTVTTGNDNSVDTHNPTSSDNYYTLMQRQERQVRRSVAESRAMSMDWIFHVDDDELLFFDTPFSRIVDGLAPGVTCIVLVNIEAAPKALDSDCIFEDIQVFTQHKMLAYRNGKSAGRVPDSDWHGPHRFTGSYHVVPVARACVLHFESCLYEQWRNKFIKHREIEEQKKKDIPFPFYRDSISLFQKDHDGGKDEERWKAFFRDRKIGNFSDLTESQKTRLALSSNMPQMINA